MRALLLLILSGILAAGVFITGKQVGNGDFSPLMILFWQMSGGALVVWLMSWPSRRFPIWDCEHLRYYLFGGLLGITLPYLLAFIVLRELQVGLVGLLTALSPVITYAMARLLGHEKGHPLGLTGLIIGFVGVVLLVAPGQSLGLITDWRYLLLALGIPVTLAASNIYRSRFWPEGSRAISLVIGMLTVQGVLLFLLNLLVGNFQHALPYGMSNQLVLAVLAVMAGASYLSSFNLLRVGGPVYLSQMGYVITAVTLLAGILLWGERYDSGDLLSMGCIFVGVLFTTWARNRQQLQTELETAGVKP